MNEPQVRIQMSRLMSEPHRCGKCWIKHAKKVDAVWTVLIESIGVRYLCDDCAEVLANKSNATPAPPIDGEFRRLI